MSYNKSELESSHLVTQENTPNLLKMFQIFHLPSWNQSRLKTNFARKTKSLSLSEHHLKLEISTSSKFKPENQEYLLTKISQVTVTANGNLAKKIILNA
jgi:hypothetical protein